MLMAVHGNEVTEQQATYVLENFGDTSFPIIVSDQDEPPEPQRVLAVVLEYGDDGYETARVVADALQTHYGREV